MNPAITAALMAAAHEEEIEKEIIGRLRDAKAIGPSSAVALELDGDKQQYLDEAIASHIITKIDDGRYYLSERAAADRKESQGFMVLLVMLIAGSAIASGVALILSTAN
jgi:hypothetical protein